MDLEGPEVLTKKEIGRRRDIAVGASLTDRRITNPIKGEDHHPTDLF